MENKKKMLPGLIGILLIAVALYYAMVALEPILLKNPKIFGYFEWASKMPESFLFKWYWIVGDFTESVAYKSLIASIGLILGCLLAHWLCRNMPKLNIYPISLGTGNLPWILVAASVGLIVSTFLYYPMLQGQALWIPTFLPGCTLPAALVIMYGGGWRVALTGGILSGIIQFPFAFVGFLLAIKLNLPPLIFLAILGICLAGVIIVELFRLMPWVKPIVLGTKPPQIKPYENKLMPMPKPKMGWMLRRSITDLTELCFFGSEIASICLILGAFLSWFLNPSHICSGIPNLFPAILASQLICGSLCAFLYFDKWNKFGFFPSFAAVIGSSVCVMQFGTSLPLIILISVLNGIITAPLSGIGFAWTTLHIKRYPTICGVAVTMGLGIAIVSIILKLLLSIGGIL